MRTAFAVLPIVGLLSGPLAGLPQQLVFGLLFGGHISRPGDTGHSDHRPTPVGLIVGLISDLIGGGILAIRHFVLRSVLRATTLAPFNYVAFLDYASKRLFLRKVGGGYIFTHRMLLEYFAALPEQK